MNKTPRAEDVLKGFQRKIGEGKPMPQLRQAYEKEVFPAFIDIVVEQSRSNFTGKKYALEVLTLGDQPYPLVHSILTLEPQKALVLPSNATAKYFTLVEDWVKGRQCPTQLGMKQVAEFNPCDVYEAIRDAARECNGPIAVDISGGRKAMVGGAAQAAAVIGADVVYVRSEKMQGFHIRPGSEQVTLLENPYEVFGDKDEGRALELAANHRYAAAAGILDHLVKMDLTQAGPRYKVEYFIAEGYACLEELDFEGGSASLSDAASVIRTALTRNQNVTPFDQREGALSEQARLAAEVHDKLTSEDWRAPLTDGEAFKALWSFTYNYALRRAKAGHYDTAVQSLYRSLELIPQRRLATCGVNVRNPDYRDLLRVRSITDEQALESAYQGVQPNAVMMNDKLPRRDIGLFQGLRLLLAVNDDVACAVSNNRRLGLLDDTWVSIQDRNRSFFAHGSKRIEPSAYRAFKDVVDEWAQAMCRAEQWDLCLLTKLLEFITLR